MPELELMTCACKSLPQDVSKMPRFNVSSWLSALASVLYVRMLLLHRKVYI